MRLKTLQQAYFGSLYLSFCMLKLFVLLRVCLSVLQGMYNCSWCKLFDRFKIQPNQRLVLCFHSHNDVPTEPQGNKSMAAIRGVRPSPTKCCYPILLVTFPEWLSGTEPWPRTPCAVQSILVVFVVFMLTHVQFWPCDKSAVIADVQWHCNHRLPFWYHISSSSEHTGCGYLGLLVGKSFGHAADGSRPLVLARRSAVPHVGLTSMGLDVASTSLWRHFDGRHPLGRLQTHAAKFFFVLFMYLSLCMLNWLLFPMCLPVCLW